MTEHLTCNRCHSLIQWGEDVDYDGSGEAATFTHVSCPILEGIELPEEITPELFDHIMERQVYVQQQVDKMRDQGLDVDAELVRVDGHVPEGWVEITCMDCARTAAAPASVVNENTITICPPCMRLRQGTKASQN